MNESASQIKSIQTLSSIAVIASPVSLIFGGVLLSLVSLICAIVARSKLKTLRAANGVDESILKMLTRQNTVGMVASIAALAINAVAFALTFGLLTQAMQTGDYSQLTSMLGLDANMLNEATNTDGAAIGTQEGSVWDRA